MKQNLKVLGEIINKSKIYLGKLDGVSKIKAYGSVFDGKADKYSDVDIEIFSDRPRNTIKGLLEAITMIGKPYVVMPIAQTEKERVYTIVWKRYPFYQKMDLKLKFSSKFPTSWMAFDYDEKLRLFHDFFIGAIRYTKYRKRGMNWAAYKFFRSSVDMWVKLQTGAALLDNFISQDKLKNSNQTKWLYPKNAADANQIMIEISSEFLKLLINTKILKRASHEYKFGIDVIQFMHGEMRIRKSSG